ncbi:MAG: ATP-dependent Clp protease proteolytic subunit [Cyclobacteriaceae bacterium]|nr:ATP-dependent Clp protease proteolytic subunit [Cyclobacteriaceae bacterium]
MEDKTEVKIPPKLFEETQTIVNELNQTLDGDFVSYWISGNSRIVGDDIIAFYEILKNNRKKNKLYLFIKSDGGSGEASLRIVNLLRKYYKNIVALIPLDCASAATMLALGADQIQMGPLAYLSSIDSSITHDLSPIDKDNDRVSVSQNELSRV